MENKEPVLQTVSASQMRSDAVMPNMLSVARVLQLRAEALKKKRNHIPEHQGDARPTVRVERVRGVGDNVPKRTSPFFSRVCCLPERQRVFRRAERAGRDGRRRRHRPLIAHVYVVAVSEPVIASGGRIPNLNVIVIPSKRFARLQSRHEVGFGKVVHDSRKQTPADKVDGVVVRQIHGGPPQPQNITSKHGRELGEDVAHE